MKSHSTVLRVSFPEFYLIIYANLSISESSHFWKVFSSDFPVHYTIRHIFHEDPTTHPSQNLGVPLNTPKGLTPVLASSERETTKKLRRIIKLLLKDI